MQRPEACYCAADLRWLHGLSVPRYSQGLFLSNGPAEVSLTLSGRVPSILPGSLMFSPSSPESDSSRLRYMFSR